MLKVFIAAVICVFCPEVYGQSRCTVYQYPVGNAAEKKIVLRQYKDREGRMLREEVRGYNNFIDNTCAMYCHREDGVYIYHYDDAQHYKTVITKYDERTGKPIDSDKVFYYYDSLNGRLNRELTVRHLNKRVPGIKPGSFRNACDIVYDNNGRVVRKKCDESDQFSSYDSYGRVVADSVVFDGDNFNIVTHYEYETDGMKAIEWGSDRRYPVVKYTRSDREGKIISEVVSASASDAGRASGANGRKWGAVMATFDGRLKEEERTEYLYDTQGQLKETHFYFKGRHTTTHEYVYDKAGADERRVMK